MYSRLFSFLCVGIFLTAAFAQSAQNVAESQFTLTDSHLRAAGLRLPSEFKSISEFIQHTAALKETQEIKLSWDSLPGKTAAITATEYNRLQVSRKFVVTSRHFLTDPPEPQAAGQMWSNMFLFVAIGKSRVRGLIIQRDPRVIFWDTPNSKGRLTGGMLYQPRGEFTLRFPNDPTIDRVLIFEPKPSINGFRLSLLAEVKL